MEYILYIFKMTVCILLDAVLVAMFLRVIFSLFGADPNGGFYGILCLVTEPFILPVRYVLESIEAIRNMPIDLSFFVTYLILNLVSGLLARGI